MAFNLPQTIGQIGADVKTDRDANNARFVSLEDLSVDRVFTGTGVIGLPEGTTAQRPGSPEEGFIRKNSTTNRIETYVRGAWRDLLVTGDTVAEGDLMYVDASGNLRKLAIGAVDQVLTTVGGLPVWQDPASAASPLGELIEEITAASTPANIELAIDNSLWNSYSFEFENFEPVNNNVDLHMQLSNDGGTSWVSSFYRYTHQKVNSTGGAIVSTTGTGSGVPGLMVATGVLNTEEGVNGAVQGFDFASATRSSRIRQAPTDPVNWRSSAAVHTQMFALGADRQTSGNDNALRVRFSAGNIADGSIVRLYGLDPV